MVYTPAHVSPYGRSFIELQEGDELLAYRDPTGTLTIGFGHTSAAGQPTVTAGMRITSAQADGILSTDLVKFEKQVRSVVKVALQQCQFDALTSFTYNCGIGNLQVLVRDSDLNDGVYSQVAAKMMGFTRSRGIVLPDLTRRRAAEGKMFDGIYPSKTDRIVLHTRRFIAKTTGTYVRGPRPVDLAA